MFGHLARGKRCIGAALITPRAVAQSDIGMYDRTRALIARRAGSPRNRFPLHNGWALLHFYARQTVSAVRTGARFFLAFAFDRFRSIFTADSLIRDLDDRTSRRADPLIAVPTRLTDGLQTLLVESFGIAILWNVLS